MLYALDQSLNSEQDFAMMAALMTTTWVKLIVFAFAAAFIYHALAGVRHLLMDLGWGEHLPAGRNSARLVIFLALIASIYVGYRLW